MYGAIARLTVLALGLAFVLGLAAPVAAQDATPAAAGGEADVQTISAAAEPTGVGGATTETTAAQTALPRSGVGSAAGTSAALTAAVVVLAVAAAAVLIWSRRADRRP